MSKIKGDINREMLGLHHASDCARHRAPAYPPGECDCGAEQTFKQRLAEVEKDLQTLKQSAREMLAELETYHDQYPGMAKGYVLDAMEQLKRATGDET